MPDNDRPLEWWETVQVSLFKSTAEQGGFADLAAAADRFLEHPREWRETRAKLNAIREEKAGKP